MDGSTVTTSRGSRALRVDASGDGVGLAAVVRRPPRPLKSTVSDAGKNHVQAASVAAENIITGVAPRRGQL
jgi:hypothetical protein